MPGTPEPGDRSAEPTVLSLRTGRSRGRHFPPYSPSCRAPSPVPGPEVAPREPLSMRWALPRGRVCKGVAPAWHTVGAPRCLLADGPPAWLDTEQTPRGPQLSGSRTEARALPSCGSKGPARTEFVHRLGPHPEGQAPSGSGQTVKKAAKGRRTSCGPQAQAASPEGTGQPGAGRRETEGRRAVSQDRAQCPWGLCVGSLWSLACRLACLVYSACGRSCSGL